MPRPSCKTSTVWTHFAIQPDKKSVICNACQKQLKFCGNTTNLWEHLKRIHPLIRDQDKVQEPLKRKEEKTTPITQNLNAVPTSPPKKRKKQLRLTASIQDNKQLSDEQIRAIDKSLVEMIVLDYQPISMVENKGFRQYSKKLNPNYTLPSRKTLTSKLIPQFYNEINSEVVEELQHVEYLSATIDCWSTNQTSFIGVTIHYIVDDKLKSTTISAREVTISQTSENTGTVLKDIFCEYGLLKKIVTVVTDSAPNLKKAIANNLNVYHYQCVAHTLHLSVNESIAKCSDLSNILFKCRGIITYFKYNVSAANKLRKKQTEMNVSDLKLKQDIVTRWNSTYIMLERLLTLKQPLTIALTELTSDTTPDKLTSSEWSIIVDCIQVLKPVFRITEELSIEKYITLSKIVPLIRGLQHILRLIEAATTAGKQLKLCLTDAISRRLGSLEATKIVAKAAFLDPRFKTSGFGVEENARNAQQWVTEELSSLIIQNQHKSDAHKMDTNNKNTDVLITTENIDENDPWSLFDNKVSQQVLSSEPTSSASKMVKQYVESKLLPRQEDPLRYWKDHMNIFPELYTLAKKYLSIPATSVPSDYFLKQDIF